MLIVECAKDGKLHAIEEVHDYCYALCGLASWLTLSNIQDLVASAKAPQLQNSSDLDGPVLASELPWWQIAACDGIRSPSKVQALQHLSLSQKAAH